MGVGGEHPLSRASTQGTPAADPSKHHKHHRHRRKRRFRVPREALGYGYYHYTIPSPGVPSVAGDNDSSEDFYEAPSARDQANLAARRGLHGWFAFLVIVLAPCFFLVLFRLFNWGLANGVRFLSQFWGS